MKHKHTSLKLTICATLTLALVYCLSRSWGAVPPFAKLLDPFQGFWQNAENVNSSASKVEIKLTGLQGKVRVLYDENHNPHIFATNDHDLYFVQGYLTAKDRLWQMELQTHAAAGRVSEILGKKAIEFDRKQRRKGMVWAAQKALDEINKEPITKQMTDSYADGVNEYISNLKTKDLPLEYKLLNYSPEPWTTLKSALLLKIMADDLSGSSNDVAYTNALNEFGRNTFDEMYPDFPTYLSPIIPRGTPYDFEALKNDTATKTVVANRVQYISDTTKRIKSDKPELPNGSNNWAVGGSKTKSGFPVLCGDPHLKLSLPSIWYEVQLCLNGKNVNGVSLPGAPGVVIGFNDSCAWSMTNAERDVKDFYHLKFRDNTKKEYWVDGKWEATTMQIETLKVKGGNTFYDTIYFTKFGPVMYDGSFKEDGMPENTAVAWVSHLPSNEMMTIYLLDHSNNYSDYEKALKWYQSPAQNFVFACKNKDIAIWEEGRFPVKFFEQGKFIQDGNNSKIVWKDFIPFEQNPHSLNPERGFVSSANQQPTDSTYPYFYYGDYYEYRSLRINKVLAEENNITVDDMKRLQNDNYNLWVEDFQTAIQNRISLADFENKLTDDEKNIFQQAWKWDRINKADAQLNVLYRLWIEDLNAATFNDEFTKKKLKLDLPNRDAFINILKTDSAFALYDNINTPQKETAADLLVSSFHSAYKTFNDWKNKNGDKATWANYRGTTVSHLAKLDAFSVKTFGDGEANSVNAITGDHGPSWRMVVSLTPQTEAYGIFPGGASGNPGSKYYDNRIKKWEHGEYDLLQIFKAEDESKATMVVEFSN